MTKEERELARRLAASTCPGDAAKAGSGFMLLALDALDAAEAKIDRLRDLLEDADAILEDDGYPADSQTRAAIRAALGEEPK